MLGVFRIALLPELALIVAPDEELDGATQGMNTARETAGFAAQACQIMAQIGVPTFDGGGLAFVRHRRVGRAPIDQVAIGRKAIAIVGECLWGLVHHRLQRRSVALQHDRPSDKRVGGSVQRRYDVDALFLVPTKV